jgi:hypothetical protein
LYLEIAHPLAGGGGIFVKNSPPFKVIAVKSCFIDKLFESTFIGITTVKGRKILIGNIYRSSSSYSKLSSTEQFEQFNEILANALSTISNNLEIFIVGDINLDVLKYEVNTQSATYIDSLFTFGFLRTVIKPTRYNTFLATLIDHCITNSLKKAYDTAIFTNHIYDHFPFITFASVILNREKKDTFTFCDFSAFNVDKFWETLSRLSWTDVVNDDNPNSVYKSFSEISFDLHKIHF